MLERLRPFVTFSLIDSPAEVKERVGIMPAEVEQLRQVMGSQGLAAAGRLLKDEWIAPFVLLGTPDECAAELRSLMSTYQMDEFVLPLMDLETAPELIDAAAEVIAAANA